MRFWRRKARERELDRELKDHMDLEAEEQRQAGLSVDESRYAARRAFGNTGLVKEETRDAWGGAFWETLGQDLRYAFRSLRAGPVFTLIAVSSLGLGIGANTAIFSFVNAILLQHLPVPEPASLVQITEYAGGEEINSAFSFPFLRELEKRSPVFDGVLSRFPVRVNLSTDSVAEPLNGEVVTGNYFSTLRVKAAVGRLLTEADIDAGAGNPVCVISYALWQGRFGGDPAILSRKLNLNSHWYSVIGVTEKGFFGPQLQSQIDLQLPVSLMGDFMGGFAVLGPGGPMWKSAHFRWLQPLARLKPGLTPAQAQGALDAVAQAVATELNDRSPANSKPTTYRLTDGSQGVNFDHTFSRPIAVLMSIVGLVLLIACANLANLLLVRAEARSKEFAVRLSLGASRGRLTCQLMVESLVIAAAGGIAGIMLSYWIIQSLLAFLNAGQSGGRGIYLSPLDPAMLGFCFLLSVLTALLFGLLPAWQSARPDLVPELKGSSGRLNVSGVRMRRLLIVFQIALSIIILFTSGLLTRTLSHLKTIQLGFDAANVITLRVDPAMAGYKPDRLDSVFNQILERLRAQPGVMSASLAVVSPLEGSMISLGFTVPGRPAKSSDTQTNFNMVSPDYFKTLNQALLAGRDFSERDTKTAPRVAIVNELFVAQYMPGQNPVGKHFNMGDRDTEIVGLARNSLYQSLREKPWPLVYLPVQQTQSSGFALLVRTVLNEHQAVAEITHAIRTLDSRLPIYGISTMQDQIDHNISSERVLSFLSLLFSGLATLLCAMGIYGLVAYSVSRRTREIGIRYAIGAQKTDVAGLFLRESVLLVLAGIVLGVPLALASTGVLRNLLYGIEPQDTATLLVTVSIFLAAGLLASVLPVRQATRIEPSEALRYE